MKCVASAVRKTPRIDVLGGSMQRIRQMLTTDNCHFTLGADDPSL
jgi:hypothetical protein